MYRFALQSIVQAILRSTSLENGKLYQTQQTIHLSIIYLPDHLPQRFEIEYPAIVVKLISRIARETRGEEYRRGNQDGV